MKEVRAYVFGLVDGVLIGVGCVDIVVAWLVARGKINLKMLDPKYVRDNYIYKPNAPWVRNHLDYSYHGRHYNPFENHTVTNPKPAWQTNPECSGCVYEGMSADFDPCKSCKRAFDGCQNDYYEYRGDEPEAEAEKPSDSGQCYKCKYFENDISESPCDDCKWAFPYGDVTHEDHFEPDEED